MLPLKSSEAGDKAVEGGREATSPTRLGHLDLVPQVQEAGDGGLFPPPTIVRVKVSNSDSLTAPSYLFTWKSMKTSAMAA